MESLLLDVPFVRKSWHKASLDPLCWKVLDSVKMTHIVQAGGAFLARFMKKYGIKKCSAEAYVKFVVGRSHGNCIDVAFPPFYTEEVFKFIADD